MKIREQILEASLTLYLLHGDSSSTVSTLKSLIFKNPAYAPTNLYEVMLELFLTDVAAGLSKMRQNCNIIDTDIYIQMPEQDELENNVINILDYFILTIYQAIFIVLLCN